MLTHKLWRALNNPPTAHPVYQRTLQTRFPTQRKHMGGWIVGSYLALCCSMTFFGTLGWLPLLLILIVLLGNTLYSLNWAMNISGSIAREREMHTYDLLCVSPAGGLAISWAICTARLFRTKLFENVYFVVRLVCVTLIIALTVALMVPICTIFNGFNAGTNLELLFLFINLLAISIIFFADHIQSIVLSSLVAIEAPLHTRPGMEARLHSIGTFLYIQLLGYGIPGIVTLFVLPAIYQVLNITGWFYNVSLALVGIGLFFAVREWLIASFWKRILENLNAESAELEHVDVAIVARTQHFS